MTLSKGKQSKQIFWAYFSGAPRKTRLIPLYGDPNTERKGITKEVIYTLYRGILPTLLANKDTIFQHNNAPTHTAYIVQELLREMGVNVIDWPPCSPDLNPIENL
jgi:transposase